MRGLNPREVPSGDYHVTVETVETPLCPFGEMMAEGGELPEATGEEEELVLDADLELKDDPDVINIDSSSSSSSNSSSSSSSSSGSSSNSSSSSNSDSEKSSNGSCWEIFDSNEYLDRPLSPETNLDQFPMSYSPPPQYWADYESDTPPDSPPDSWTEDYAWMNFPNPQTAELRTIEPPKEQQDQDQVQVQVQQKEEPVQPRQMPRDHTLLTSYASVSPMEPGSPACSSCVWYPINLCECALRRIRNPITFQGTVGDWRGVEAICMRLRDIDVPDRDGRLEAPVTFDELFEVLGLEDADEEMPQLSQLPSPLLSLSPPPWLIGSDFDAMIAESNVADENDEIFGNLSDSSPDPAERENPDEEELDVGVETFDDACPSVIVEPDEQEAEDGSGESEGEGEDDVIDDGEEDSAESNDDIGSDTEWMMPVDVESDASET